MQIFKIFWENSSKTISRTKLVYFPVKEFIVIFFKKNKNDKINVIANGENSVKVDKIPKIKFPRLSQILFKYIKKV